MGTNLSNKKSLIAPCTKSSLTRSTETAKVEMSKLYGSNDMVSSLLSCYTLMFDAANLDPALDWHRLRSTHAPVCSKQNLWISKK